MHSRFEPPPSNFVLPARGEVHVWMLRADDLSGCLGALGGLLSEDENDRARRFRLERDRNLFCVARAMLRVLLGRYIGRSPGSIDFGYGVNGKPFLKSDDALDIEFNLAHSSDVVVYGFSTRMPVGIDVEWIKESGAIEEMAAFFFSPAENDALREIPPARRLEAFFTCWVRKEAYAKARGLGMSLPSRKYTVSVDPLEVAQVRDDRSDEPSAWSIVDFRAGEDAVGAVAVRGDLASMRMFDAAPIAGEF